MLTTRDKFATRFGEKTTGAIEGAANSHANGTNDRNRGSDPFKWTLLICIGYECVAKYQEDHGLDIDAQEFRKFCVEEANLLTHDGDFDYMALFTGAYEFLNEIAEEPKS